MSYKSLSITFLILLFSSFTVTAQSEVDSLMKKSKRDFIQLLLKTTDKEKQDFYARIFIKKGKKEKDTETIATGYHFLANNRYGTEKVLPYCDSIISLTSKKSLDRYPAVAYQFKGDYYLIKKAYQKALENFLIVSSLAKKHNQSHMLFRSNYNIALLKRLTGNYAEALTIFKENLPYPKENPESVTDVEYLNSVIAISDVFNDLKMVDSATFYNKYTMKEATRLNNNLYFTNGALNQGVTFYHQKKFQTAIDTFERYIPDLVKIRDLKQKSMHRLSISLFYCGKSYAELNNKEKAISYFKKVDTLFLQDKNLFPSLKKTYEYLIKYYKEKNDFESQLTYVNRLIEVNNILYSDEIYLNKGIITEYDIPKLEAQKENLNQQIKSQGSVFKNTIILLSILIVLLLIGFGIQYKKRQLYKKRFQEIINDKSSNTIKNEVIEKEDSNTINIPDNIIKEILGNLEKFEKNNEFISNKITLNYLAKKLGTNPNYLSKIINHYKKCSFTKYLNNLRIDYTIEQLKENNTYRKYTIKAIASEVGFNNVQSFAKAFHNSKGINPSFFLRELKKAG